MSEVNLDQVHYLMHLVKRGVVSKEMLQKFLDNPNGLDVNAEVFKVSISYDPCDRRSIWQVIWDCDFEQSLNDQTVDSLVGKHSDDEEVSVNLKFVQIDDFKSTREVRAIIRDMGLTPAKFEHGVALFASCPALFNDRRVYFMGSVYMDKHKVKQIASIWNNDEADGRNLSLRELNENWDMRPPADVKRREIDDYHHFGWYPGSKFLCVSPDNIFARVLKAIK